MVHILLVDEHDLVRVEIKSLLDTVNGIEVVGETSSSEDALKLVKKLQPNVI